MQSRVPLGPGKFHVVVLVLNKVIAFGTFVVEKATHSIVLVTILQFKPEFTRTHSQILSGHLALPPLPEPCVTMQEPCTRLPDVISGTLSIPEYMYMRRVTRKSLPETSEVER